MTFNKFVTNLTVINCKQKVEDFHINFNPNFESNKDKQYANDCNVFVFNVMSWIQPTCVKKMMKSWTKEEEKEIKRQQRIFFSLPTGDDLKTDRQTDRDTDRNINRERNEKAT